MGRAIPRVRLVTYATRPFRKAQELNAASARAVGGFATIVPHSPADIDRAFATEHRQLLRAKKGGGYWLWKPYFVLRHLRELAADEWLFYCDAGARFVSPIAPLVEHALEHGTDMLTFELEPFRLERIWTKRDAFVLLDCDAPRFHETPQRLGGYLLWRRSDATLDLAQTWLRLACDARILSDAPNTCGLPNLDGFKEHRHDQSILSLLTKARGIAAWRSPCQYGTPRMPERPDCRYPQIILATRDRAPTALSRLKATRRLLTGARPPARGGET